jgi:hypothetical protein
MRLGGGLLLRSLVLHEQRSPLPLPDCRQTPRAPRKRSSWGCVGEVLYFVYFVEGVEVIAFAMKNAAPRKKRKK